MKKWKKGLCLLLSVLLVSSAGSAGTLSASAQELTNDSMRQKEEEIKKAKEEIKGGKGWFVSC